MKEELSTIRDAAEAGITTNSQGRLLKTICKVLVSIVDRMDKAEANKQSALQSVEEGKEFYETKPMKATLIYKSTIHSMGMSIDSIYHEPFDTSDPTTARDDADSLIVRLNAKEPDLYIRGLCPLYIHIDGMLFEYTSKPVLAEVGTGIEI